MSKGMSFLLRYGVALGIGVLLTLQVVQWFRPSTDSTLSRQDPSPRVLEPIRDIEKLAPAVTLPPQEIVALKPDKAALAKIEKKLGAPLPASVREGRSPLLSVKEIGELCHGGKLVLTLEPVDVTSPDGPKTVQATVYPNPLPFFEWTLKRELSVSYGKAFGSGDLSGPFVHLDLRQSIARTGPVRWFVAGGGYFGQGWQNLYAEVGFVATF